MLRACRNPTFSVHVQRNLYKTKPEGLGRGPRSSPSMAPNKKQITRCSRNAAKKTRHPTLVLLGNIPTNRCLAHVYKKSQHVELQKSASRLKPRASFSPPVADAITPAFWYSPTRFSKKFVLPCKEINSIQSKGLLTLKILVCPNDVNNRSATNSMYF